jgi:hypothetical protein
MGTWPEKLGAGDAVIPSAGIDTIMNKPSFPRVERCSPTEIKNVRGSAEDDLNERVHPGRAAVAQAL